MSSYMVGEKLKSTFYSNLNSYMVHVPEGESNIAYTL